MLTVGIEVVVVVLVTAESLLRRGCTWMYTVLVLS